MSTNDSPFSIFSSNAKKNVKSAPAKNDIPETLNKNRESKRKLEEMMDRMSGIRLSLEDKIEQFSRKKGLTKEEIWHYINNSGNFTAEEWEVIRGKNKQMVNKVWDIVESASRGESSGSKQDAGSKGKHIGARKKWIPTR